MIKVLVHRYSNEPDILAVEKNGCSDVYKAVDGANFEYLIVVPTLKARTQRAIIARALGPQERADSIKDWPGRPDKYVWRVKIDNVRYITLDQVKRAFLDVGQTWTAQWTVKNLWLPDYLIEPDDASSISLRTSNVEPSEPSAIEGVLKEVVSYPRSRNSQLRDIALKNSNGICAVCDINYNTILKGQGVRVLQVHHKNQLSLNIKPVTTTLSDLVVVCANCHMLIHLDPKNSLSVQELRKMLGK